MAGMAAEARLAIGPIAAYTPLSAVIITAFACGVVVGGSAMWLSGASRQAGARSTASQQTPLVVSRAEASPVAPVGTALAKTPVVPPSTRNRSPFRGSLVVNSRPSGALVSLNGRSVGRTPLVLRNQPAGSRAIRVDLDGYEPWSSAVQVVADTETRLRAELKMQRPAAQP
jgi:PEGA domain